jgi:hypothetical protein
VNCDNENSNREVAALRPKKAVLLVQMVFLCRLRDVDDRGCLSCSADTEYGGGQRYTGINRVSGSGESGSLGARSQD